MLDMLNAEVHCYGAPCIALWGQHAEEGLAHIALSSVLVEVNRNDLSIKIEKLETSLKACSKQKASLQKDLEDF